MSDQRPADNGDKVPADIGLAIIFDKIVELERRIVALEAKAVPEKPEEACQHDWDTVYNTPHSDYLCNLCGERRPRTRVYENGIKQYNLNGEAEIIGLRGGELLGALVK